MLNLIASLADPSMADSIADAIQKFTSTIANHFVAFLSAMAGVGILSMAIIQAVKDSFPVRRWFQKQWLERWFECKASEANSPGRKWGADADKAESDLIKLATDDNGNAFYDLPIEQLCGQFNAAIQIALDSPSLHKDLVATTAALAERSDLELLFSPPDAVKKPLNPADQAQVDQRQKFIDARTRVTHQVQRAIDAVQISAGFRWKFYLQVASFILSALIAGAGVAFFGGQGTGGNLITVIVTGILGGFLAPVARDLVAALQQLRK